MRNILLTLVLCCTFANGAPVIRKDFTDTLATDAKIDNIKVEENQLGDGILGDKTDLFEGTVKFKRTDISIPGNSKLEVAHHSVLDTNFPSFVGFQSDLPRIELKYLNDGKKIDSRITSWKNGNFCSGKNTREKAVILQAQHMFPHNPSLIIPNKTSSEIILSNGNVVGSKFTNSDFYKIDCYRNSKGFDGFKVVDTDGNTYFFDVLLNSMDNKSLVTTEAMVEKSTNSFINIQTIYVSKVVDIYGNHVSYEYNDHGIKRIISNDGREIRIEWNGKDKHIIASNRRVIYKEYEYMGMEQMYDIYEQKVIEPDGRFWTYTIPLVQMPEGIIGSFCDMPEDLYMQEAQPLTVTNPDGLVGVYNFLFTWQGVSNGYKDESTSTYCSFPFSLVSKKIEYLDGNKSEWNISYSQNHGFFKNEKYGRNSYITGNVPKEVQSPHYRKTSIKSKKGRIDIYFNRNSESYAYRNPIITQIFDSNSNLLKSIYKKYKKSPQFGRKLQNDRYGSHGVIGETSLLTYKRIKQGNDEFITTYDDFTKFGKPKKITEYNNFSDDKLINIIQYVDFENVHVIGKEKSSELKDFDGNVFFDKRYEYYNNGSVKEKKVSGKEFKRYTYNKDGTIKTEQNGENGKKSIFVGYYRGKPLKINTDCSSCNENISESFAYDYFGNKIKHINSAKEQTNYSYDKNDRLTKTLKLYGNLSQEIHRFYKENISKYGLSGDLMVEEVITGDKVAKTYTDGAERVVLLSINDIKEDKEIIKCFKYDDMNNLIFQSNPSFNSCVNGISTDFDILNRKITESLNNATKTFDYEDKNTIKIKDYVGVISRNSYLAFGKPAYETPKALYIGTSSELKIKYRADKKIKEISSGDIIEKRFYSNNGYLCRISRLDIGERNFLYDDIGQLKYESSGSYQPYSFGCNSDNIDVNQGIVYQYDEMERLVRKESDNILVVKEYDSSDNVTKIKYRKGSETNNIEYKYVYEDKLLSEDYSSSNLNAKVSYFYNNYGNVVKNVYNEDLEVGFVKNALGQTKDIIFNGDTISSIKYHPDGSYSSIKRLNSVATTRSIDENLRVTRLLESNSGKRIFDSSYHYHKDGNIKRIINSLDKKRSINNIVFDRFNRISKMNGFSGKDNFSYSYDNNNNINNVVKNSKPYLNYEYRDNLLVGVSGKVRKTLDYDDIGNITRNGDSVISFDSFGQISSNSSQSNFAYDGRGLRTQRGRDYFAYDKNQNLIYQEINGKKEIFVYIGSVNLFSINPDTLDVTYHHYDINGSKIFDTGINANVFNVVYYEPFGGIEKGERNSIGYTGHVHDQDSKIIYMKARYYDPLISRFYSNDPVYFEDNFHQFNRFLYANNNPFMFYDPDGRAGVNDLGSIIGQWLMGKNMEEIAETQVDIAEERVEVIAEAVSYTPLGNALTVADLAKDMANGDVWQDDAASLIGGKMSDIMLERAFGKTFDRDTLELLKAFAGKHAGDYSASAVSQ